MGWRDNNTRCPCKECGDRVPEPNCHGYCDRYIAWQAENRERNEKNRVEQQGKNVISEAKRRELWRKKRYSRQARYATFRDE